MQFEAFPAPQEAAILEHVSGVRVERPVAALSGAVWAPRDLDEAVVEGEVVAQRVLPPLGILSVCKSAHQQSYSID